MNILEWFSNDEYKQKEFSKILVEAAIIQVLLSFLMCVLYAVTDIEPLFLLITPFAAFLYYSLIRYVLSGIEFANVFNEEDKNRMQKRNLVRALSLVIGFFLLSLLINRNLLDSAMVSLIAGALLYLIDTISLRKSFRKNADL